MYRTNAIAKAGGRFCIQRRKALMTNFIIINAGIIAILIGLLLPAVQK